MLTAWLILIRCGDYRHGAHHGWMTGLGAPTFFPYLALLVMPMTPTDYFNGADLGKTIAIYDDDP